MSGKRHSAQDQQHINDIVEKAIALGADHPRLMAEMPPAEWTPSEGGKAFELSTAFGGEVKSAGDGIFEGYLIRFTSEDSPDLTGDFFTKSTDFGIPPEGATSPVFFHHRQPIDAEDGSYIVVKSKLGDGHLRVDDVGVFIRAVTKARDKYEKAIAEMGRQDLLGWSSGTASHLVDREQVGKAFFIKSWPLGLDASLTPTPAEPRNAARAMKAYIDGLNTAPAATPAPAQADTPAPAEKEVESAPIQQETQTMTDEIKSDTNAALLAAIEKLTKEVSEMKSAPAERTPGIAGMVADNKAPAQIAPALPMADDQLYELKRYLKSAVDPDSKRAWDEHQTKVRQHADEAAHMKAFQNWMRNPGNYDAYQAARNAQMKTALAEGTASLGGNLVPTLYNNQLVGTLKEDSIVRRAGAYQFPIAGTNSLKVTTITRSASAALVAEGASVAGQEPTFGLVSFDAYAYKATAVASRESIADSRFDVGTVLNENFAWQFTQSENNQFAIGTGSSQPQGIAVGATMSVSGGSTLALALANGDKLIDLQHALPYQYRPNAVWFMNDQVIKAIRTIKWATTSGAASTTQYNAYVFPVAGDTIAPFGRLLGNPVYPLNTMASSGSTGAVAVFADPRFFWIADFALGGTEIQQLNERYADNWQVGWNAWRRFDSNLMVSEAAVSMKLL